LRGPSVQHVHTLSAPAQRVGIAFPHPFISGVFCERPNRFISHISLPQEGGITVKAYVPDPGRLKELLYPGAQVFLKDHGADTHRKLRYSLELVATETGQLVSLNTQLPNRVVGTLLAQHQLPGFEDYTLQKREYTYGDSRIDFLLENPNQKPCLLEVKSCTLVETRAGIGPDAHQSEKLALFPDAPSLRGTRHLQELIRAQAEGMEARVLFVIQRGDPTLFSPNFKTDPALATTLHSAWKLGIKVQAYAFELSLEGCFFVKEVPIAFIQAL